MVRVRTAVKEIMGRRSKIDKTDSGLYTVERKWSDWDRLVSSLVAGGMFGLSLISPAAAIADEMPGVPYKKPPEVSSTENPIKEPPKPEEDEVKPRVIASEHEFEGRTNTFARTSLEFKDPKTGLYLLRSIQTVQQDGLETNLLGVRIPILSSGFNGHVDLFGKNEGNFSGSGAKLYGLVLDRLVLGGGLERALVDGSESSLLNLHAGINFDDAFILSVGGAQVQRGEDVKQGGHGLLLKDISKLRLILSGGGAVFDDGSVNKHFGIGQYSENFGEGLGWRFAGTSYEGDTKLQFIFVPVGSKLTKNALLNPFRADETWHNNQALSVVENVMRYFRPSIPLMGRTYQGLGVGFEASLGEEENVSLQTAISPFGLLSRVTDFRTGFLEYINWEFNYETGTEVKRNKFLFYPPKVPVFGAFVFDSTGEYYTFLSLNLTN